MDEGAARRLYQWTAAAGLVSAAAFAAAILFSSDSGVSLHEWAGAALLGLLAVTFVVALYHRKQSPQLLTRSIVALVILVAMGGAGAALAVGALPSSLDHLPIVLLVALMTAQAEMIRVGRTPTPTAA